MQAHLAPKEAKVAYMQETFKARMKRLRLRAGFKTHQAAADAIGCTRGNVSMWEAPSSDVKSVGEYLLRVAVAYKVKPDYINSGKGDDGYPWLGDSASQAFAPIAPSATVQSYVRYQVMGIGGAGPGVINPDYPEVLREVEIAEWQLREEIGFIPAPSRVKLLTVRGNSMSPRIRNGDVVFVDVEDQRPEDGCLFAIVLQGHTLVKKLEFRTDGVHIVSLAVPDRPDIVSPDNIETLRIAGRVLGAIQLRRSQDL